MRQTFFTSIADAAAFAELASSRGFEAYHACAVFKDDSSRKASNVAGAKCFWLDIDVGPKKLYTEHRAALAALFEFSQKLGWPTPSIVSSGGGWHAYWTLEELLPVPVWQAFANKLRDACQAHNMHADHGITIDVARILRPPGTRNYKRAEPAPVELKFAAAPVSVRALVAGLQPALPAAAPIVGTLPANLFGAVDNSKFTAKTSQTEVPSYAGQIVQGCKQLAYFRDVGGAVDEPLWYAHLCLLASCADGEKLAHDWSSGDERYSYEDTARKLEQGRRNSGPTTCERFQSLNPTGCAGCPHFGRVVSPIQLGRTQAAEPAAADGASPFTATSSGTEWDGVILPPPPSPFRRSLNGALITSHLNDEGVSEWVTVYKCPLFLDNIREHEQAGSMSLVFRHWLPKEGWLEINVPWTDRSQKAVINHMGSQKLNVPRARERDMLNFIEASIDEFQSHKRTAMEYAQFGWRNDFNEFVLGSELYTSGVKGGKPIGVTQELVSRAKQMRPYGTFEAWRSAAQPLFVHEQQGLMVVAGFASVLMRFVTEMTGIIIAAVSPEPRLGKTMGLVAARSIWGDDNAIDIATNDTANSRFRMLAVLNGLPSTWDDMRKSNDPEIIKQFVLSFSQGRDKNRLDKSGAMRSNISGWSSILLATSNISIAELVGHDGETAQQSRILEYRFQPMEGMKFSDGQNYERILRANRGHAGRRFVEALMLPGMVPWLQKAVPEYVREFEKQLARSDASFYATFLGCMKAAAEILNKTGMLEFSVDRLIIFAVESANAMGRMMEENKVNPIEVLTRFINDNWANALVVNEAFKPKHEASIRKLPGQKLFVRYELAPARIYIDRDAFKQWCRPRNIMFRDIVERLAKKGIVIEQQKRINLGAGTPFSAGGQIAAIEVDAAHTDLGNLREIEKEFGGVTALPNGKRILVPGRLREQVEGAS